MTSITTLFAPCCESDLLAPEMVATIQAAIEKLKQVRFQLEREGNLTGLQQLEAEMLSELDLLEATKWGVKQKQLNI